jgi:outer membrane protein OmpA-like peptidoglycan-associated protein
MIMLAGVCQLPALAQEEQDLARFKLEEIQAAVMSFSDSFSTSIHEIALNLENNVGTPDVYLHMDQFKLYSMMAAYDIASSPYPGVALLDMMVLTALKVIVWEDYWVPRVYGEAARPVLDKLQRLEAELWGYAATVLTPDQMREIRELVLEWRSSYPDTIGVNFLRFSHFGELGRKPSLEAAREEGGLFGNIKEATDAADEIRAMGERMMFLILRMQEMVGQRVEMSIKEILRTPEVTGFLANMNGFEQNADRYAGLLDSLPEELAAETNTTATGIVDRVSIERQAAINQLLNGVKLERQALMVDVSRLVQHSKNSTEAIATQMFVLAASLLLLYFLMRLMLRYLIDHPSLTFFSTLGVGLMLGMIALLVIVTVLIYMPSTRPEPIEFTVTAPSSREEMAAERHQDLHGAPASIIPEAVPDRKEGDLPAAEDQAAVSDREVLSVQTLFGSRSSIVSPQFHSLLDAVVALLEKDERLQVEAHGYSDGLGDPVYNQVLSEQRAFAVVRYLEAAGINAARLQANGHGASSLVAADDTASGRARNRRVEIIVIEPSVPAP